MFASITMLPPEFVAFMAVVAAEILFPVSVAFTLLATAVDDNETPVVALRMDELCISKIVGSVPRAPVKEEVNETPVVKPSMLAPEKDAFVPATDMPVVPVPAMLKIPKSAYDPSAFPTGSLSKRNTPVPVMPVRVVVPMLIPDTPVLPDAFRLIPVDAPAVWMLAKFA